MLYNMSTPELGIVIPCYNEYSRMSASSFNSFLDENEKTFLLFVNDASTDDTLAVLQEIHLSHPRNTGIINLQKNSGKAFAVREGILHMLQNTGCPHIGYLDSDLSTGFRDYMNIYETMLSRRATYAFGSRIKMKNAIINRKAWRHVVGRMIATLMDSRFKLQIYDTQCGAKIFESTLAGEIFRDAFFSRWLFDVELFVRINKKYASAYGLEVALSEWTEKKGSKLNLLSFGRITRDIFTIFSNYK